MKALDKIRERAAGRRNARLTARIAQAAERCQEEILGWMRVVDSPAPDPYPEDYYTQPVGSERHRAAYISCWEAHGGPDFGMTLDEEYNSDHYSEIQIERSERQRMQDCDRTPAVDESGNKYFADGQIVSEDGREIAPPYTPE